LRRKFGLRLRLVYRQGNLRDWQCCQQQNRESFHLPTLMRSDSLPPRSIDQIEIETRRLSEGSVISAGGRENGLRIFLELRPDLSPLFGFTWDDGACDASSRNGTWDNGAWADLSGKD